MSKEQIEEMAQVIAQNWNKDCLDVPFSDIRMRESEVCIANVPSCRHCLIARSLINAGYRKQSVGEWVVKDLNNPMYESKKSPNCSNCGYMSFIRYDFCPNCGAKMRKEDEGK